MKQSERIAKYTDKYSPIDPELIEITEKIIQNNKSGKVHYFDFKEGIGMAEGQIKGILKSDEGVFLRVDEQLVRVDKIITILGRPGAAYDQYDRYANVCLTCEDLGQFGQ
ncbi:MAG: hypothetical protein ACJA08_003440 [Cyclobacteriaceae bacterium]|jgi:hypothetical protein